MIGLKCRIWMMQTAATIAEPKAGMVAGKVKKQEQGRGAKRGDLETRGRGYLLPYSPYL